MSKRVIFFFIFSSILISSLSYIRYYITGSLSLEVYPSGELWSLILFTFYLLAVVFALFAYYGVIFKVDYSFNDIRLLSYFLYFFSFLSLPLLSNDIFIYLAIGDIVENIGLNPYTDYRFFNLSSFDLYVSPSWRGTSYFKYGPLHGMLMYLVSLFSFGGGIWVHLFIYKFFVFLSGIIIIEFCYFILCGDAILPINLSLFERKRIFSFIVLSPVLWIQGIGQGHNDIFVALFLFIGLYFMLRYRYFYASLFFVFAFGIKLYALFFVFILVYYILLRYRFSYLGFVWSFLVIGFSFLVGTLLYLPFWDGYDTFLSYFSLLSELKTTMNSLSFLLSYLTLLLTDSLSASFVDSFFRYLILFLAVIVGFYLVYKMKDNLSSFSYLFGKAFVLLFSFGVSRFHPWYFMVVLVFFAFRGVSQSWFLWGVIFFSLVNLVDIYNFMDHGSISIMVALPLSLVLVNLLLLYKFKERFIEL